MRLDVLANRRSVIWIGNEQLEIAVAQGGGHISALRWLAKPKAANPFWQPPWRSLEPEDVTDSAVEQLYGGAPEGRLLASILGHSLALDLYGAPSPEEAAAGAVTHGKAGVLPWSWEQTGPETLLGECLDGFAQLKFSRRLTLKGSCVVIEERVQNHCAFDRPLAWQQHVSLGPEFCGQGFWASANCDLGATHPESFGAGASLIPKTETAWPLAPRRHGGFSDYRQPLEAGAVANDFTGYRIRPGDPVGGFVAGNTRFGFAIFYLWPRHFFPWLGIWDEQHAREPKPWEKRASVRAYEFGVSPHPLSRRQMLETPRLFDLPTFLILPGRGALWVRYMLGVFGEVAEPGELEISAQSAALVSAGRELARVPLGGELTSSERREMHS